MLGVAQSHEIISVLRRREYQARVRMVGGQAVRQVVVVVIRRQHGAVRREKLQHAVEWGSQPPRHDFDHYWRSCFCREAHPILVARLGDPSVHDYGQCHWLRLVECVVGLRFNAFRQVVYRHLDVARGGSATPEAERMQPRRLRQLDVFDRRGQVPAVQDEIHFFFGRAAEGEKP